MIKKVAMKKGFIRLHKADMNHLIDLTMNNMKMQVKKIQKNNTKTPTTILRKKEKFNSLMSLKIFLLKSQRISKKIELQMLWRSAK